MWEIHSTRILLRKKPIPKSSTWVEPHRSATHRISIAVLINLPVLKQNQGFSRFPLLPEEIFWFLSPTSNPCTIFHVCLSLWNSLPVNILPIVSLLRSKWLQSFLVTHLFSSQRQPWSQRFVRALKWLYKWLYKMTLQKANIACMYASMST